MIHTRRTVSKAVQLVIAVFGAAIMGWTPARGCSPTPEYVQPSNYELVQLADAIVVAEASLGEHGVGFRTVEVLKGAPPASFVSSRARIGRPPPSPVADLGLANPEAYEGGCVRYTFAVGQRYVIFLEKGDDGGFYEMRFPFARINEDYSALWADAIRTYLQIQQREPMAQMAALRDLLRSELAQPTTADRIALARDIAGHLQWLSPRKPTAFLLDVFAALDAGRPSPVDLDVLLAGAPAPTIAAFKAPPPEQRADFPTATTAEQKHAVLEALVLGEHPGASALFKRLAADPALSTADLGLVIRYLAKNGEPRLAFALIETNAMRVLPALPADEAQALIGDIGNANLGLGRGSGDTGWRNDPYVARAWPELALSLYWLQARSLGQDRAVAFDAIEAIPISDYRARPLLALALAAGGDDKVVAWAMARLARPPRDASRAEDDLGLDDPALLPIEVLARSSGDGRDAALEKAVCHSPSRRYLVIEALGTDGNSADDQLIKRIAAQSGLSDSDRDALGLSLAQMLGDGRTRDYALLEQIVRREKIELTDPIFALEPIACAAH